MEFTNAKGDFALPKVIKVAIGVVIVIIALLIFLPFKIIHAGQKGLLFRLGAIQERVLDQGIHFRIPLVDKIRSVTIQPIQLNDNVEVGPNGSITKDNQTVGAQMVVFYKYKDNELVKMWKDYGTDKTESLVSTSLKEAFKEVIGGKTIFEIASSQDSIGAEVITRLRAKTAQYPVEVVDMKITNYDWSDEFDKQIAQTMNRSQQVKQAEQELLITEQEAQKKVKEAEADKAALVTKAEGEKAAAALMAEAKSLEGEGIRKYNEAVAKNMDLEVRIRQLEIEKIKAEKWDGKLIPSQVFTPIPLNLGATMQDLGIVNK